MKPRSGDSSRGYRLPKSALVYCYRRTTDGVEYLLLRRTAKYGGFWQGVTGALEEGETLEEGAARELWEETGYERPLLQAVDLTYRFAVEDEWRHAYHIDVTEIQEHVFLVEIPAGLDPVLSFEHEAFEWVQKERALTMLKWPNNLAALEACHRAIHGVSQDRGD
jgi:dihydroneopterin triphosphate diphosphatase